MVSLFDLIDNCRVETLASTSFSFDALCDRIENELDKYCKKACTDGRIQYVTVSPRVISYAKPEEILWVFLLLNPETPFRKHLDPKREALLNNALKLDPDDFKYGRGYQYDDVAEKLGCSRMEGIYITTYWEILPVYSDSERKTINLQYLIEKSGTAELAAELYSIYASCSEAKAEKAVQEYLAKAAENLYSLYPGGKLDVRGDEVVMHISFSGDDFKAAWLGIDHPFFRANSPVPERSAEAFYNYLLHSIYRYLSNAYGYKDHHIAYNGYLTNGYESEEKIEFIRHEQYSYHDGGGGTRDSLCISTIPEDVRNSLNIPDKLMHNEYYSKRSISMPPCDGYWDDGEVLYVMNPFEMKDIFIMESTDESWD